VIANAVLGQVSGAIHDPDIGGRGAGEYQPGVVVDDEVDTEPVGRGQGRDKLPYEHLRPADRGLAGQDLQSGPAVLILGRGKAAVAAHAEPAGRMVTDGGEGVQRFQDGGAEMVVGVVIEPGLEIV